MQKTIPGLIAALTTLLVLANVTASQAEPNEEIEELRHRLEKLESREIGPEGFSLKTGDRRLTLFGALEVEGAYTDSTDRTSESDITVATALLGFDAALSDRVKARLILLHEEGEEPSIDIDEANLSLSRPDTLGGTLMAKIGRWHLPFGAFTSVMVTDPLTLDLGEITKTGFLAGWENGMVSLQMVAFNGDRDTTTHDVIDSGVAALTFTPTENISFGVSYLGDLTESNADLLGDATTNYEENVNAASANLTVKFTPVTCTLEYLGALEEFSEAMLADPNKAAVHTGRKPRAWFIEAIFAPGVDWAVSCRYERARDFQDDLTRYGSTFSYGLDAHTTLSLEYLYGDYANNKDNSVSQFTAQLALEF